MVIKKSNVIWLLAICMLLTLIAYFTIPKTYAAGALIEESENPVFLSVADCKDLTPVYEISVYKSRVSDDDENHDVSVDESYMGYINFKTHETNVSDLINSEYIDIDSLSSMPVSECSDIVQYVDSLITTYTDVTKIDDLGLLTDDIYYGSITYGINTNFHNIEVPEEYKDWDQQRELRVRINKMDDCTYPESVSFLTTLSKDDEVVSDMYTFKFRPMDPEAEIMKVDSLYLGCSCSDLEGDCVCTDDCESEGNCDHTHSNGGISEYARIKS